jgi:hypothetical protein
MFLSILKQVVYFLIHFFTKNKEIFTNFVKILKKKNLNSMREKIKLIITSMPLSDLSPTLSKSSGKIAHVAKYVLILNVSWKMVLFFVTPFSTKSVELLN